MYMFVFLCGLNVSQHSYHYDVTKPKKYPFHLFCLHLWTTSGGYSSPVRLLKLAKRIISVPLATIFNQSLCTGIFPSHHHSRPSHWPLMRAFLTWAKTRAVCILFGVWFCLIRKGRQQTIINIENSIKDILNNSIFLLTVAYGATAC